MDLTPSQKDALTELITIGHSRAAGALSELTGYRIRLDVPEVAIHSIGEIMQMLGTVVHGEVASVNQVFSGPISGNALLLLDEKAALMLNKLLTSETYSDKLDVGAREVVTEVGNIVLNACLGVFGNLLQVHVSFTVPRLQVDSIETVLNSITIANQELRYALMIHTQFHLRESDVTGYMVLILGIASFDRMLLELKKWEERQVA